MSHELEIVNGKVKMAAVVNDNFQEPWHGLGQRASSEQTAEEMIRLAELDTENHLEPIFLQSQRTIDDIPIIGQKIPEKQAVVREDGMILGVVGPNYQIIQNRDCFSFLDDIIGSGQAVYHTAGSLFNGSRIFITIRLPEQMMIGQDPINKYLLLTSSHDGSMAVHVKFTPIRVVCNNTLSLAMLKGQDEKIKGSFAIRHTSSFKGRIAECRKALKLCDYYYKHMEEEFNKLLDQKFSDNEMEKFASEILPATINQKGTKKVSTKLKNNRRMLQKLFHKGLGQKEVANTKYAAFNAVTEFVDHHRSSRIQEAKKEADVRFDSIINKSGSLLREKAFQILTAV
jgi:phage/plasmid-like protein (TIGR03299 family)